MITAEIVTCDTAKVLRLVDSVKIIRFQVFDSEGIKQKHLLDDMSATISKSYGWKRSLNFNLFPDLPNENHYFQPFNSFTLVGLDNPRLGLQNLTWFDVFDFQPGEILHVHYIDRQCGNNWNIIHRMTSLTYLNRTDYKDSIVYMVEKSKKSL